MTKRKPWLFFGGAITLVLLALLQATGWLVRAQLHILSVSAVPGEVGESECISCQDSATNAGERRRGAAIAASHPDDYLLQVGAAVLTTPDPSPDETTPATDSVRVRALNALQGRYGNRPDLAALQLTSVFAKDRFVFRAEEEAVDQHIPLRQAAQEGPRFDAEHRRVLAIEDAIAARGEALDPENGFFPTMRATILLQLHQDGEAFAEIRRAASCPVWNDYRGDEIRARWHFHEALYGRTGSLEDGIVATEVHSRYAIRLRAFGRMVAAIAVLHEEAGDAAIGYRLRHDLARLGAAMRTRSVSMEGVWIGNALTRSAYSLPKYLARDVTPISYPTDHIAASPGDAYTPHNPQTAQMMQQDDDLRHSMTQRSLAFLNRTGHSDEAGWYAAEVDAGTLSDAEGFAVGAGHLQQQTVITAGWATGLFLLVAAGWALVAGGIAALLSRLPSVRAGRRLQPCVSVGFGLMLSIPCAAAIASVMTDVAQPLIETAAVSLVIGFAPLFLLARGGARGRALLRSSCLAILTSLCGWGTLIAAGLSLNHPLHEMQLWRQLLGYETPFLPSGNILTDPRSIQFAILWYLPVLLPLFVVLGMAGIALFRGIRRTSVPAPIRLIHGVCTAALPVAGSLLLLYGVILSATVTQENARRDQMQVSLIDEGRYRAALLGEQWPGPVPEPISHP